MEYEGAPTLLTPSSEAQASRVTAGEEDREREGHGFLFLLGVARAASLPSAGFAATDCCDC